LRFSADDFSEQNKRIIARFCTRLRIGRVRCRRNQNFFCAIAVEVNAHGLFDARRGFRQTFRLQNSADNAEISFIRQTRLFYFSRQNFPLRARADGDGKADPAVFRASTLTWFIQKSSGGTDIISFGATGDKPVPADYDGDAKADIAIFRPNGANGAEWWIRRSTNASVFALTFGTATDKAVAGDFTGDGKADTAIWRPADGNWFVLRSEDFSFYAFPFGANGDTPVPGDYDGDSKIDAAVFRPSSNTWFIQRSTAGTLIQPFGIANDLPIPSVFVQ
jgi:hypothetical protein